jgi:hypothetical protein
MADGSIRLQEEWSGPYVKILPRFLMSTDYENTVYAKAALQQG